MKTSDMASRNAISYEGTACTTIGNYAIDKEKLTNCYASSQFITYTPYRFQSL